MDVERLKQSWSLVTGHGDQVSMFFYSALFLGNPELRQMFPMNMAMQRDRLFTALGHVVSHVDQLDRLGGFLHGLGADHRKFAVRPEHYPAVGEALLTTLRHFLGPQWSRDLAADWATAYGLVSRLMIDGARAAESVSPPWWVGRVMEFERHGFDVAVLTLRPSYLLPFTPGQSVGLSHPQLRMWRYFSPANAPRADGTLELHVRAVPGGVVSSRLVYDTSVGDEVHLSGPVGEQLTLASSGGADLLLLAGGTGWAPLKALVEQVAAENGRRRVQLYVGTRSRAEFYDGDGLAKLASSYPWLTVRYAQAGTGEARSRPQPVDHALTDGDWRGRHVYVCGSDSMVNYSVSRLQQAGYREGQVHHEAPGGFWYGSNWRLYG